MTSRTAAGTLSGSSPAASARHSSRAKKGCPPLRPCTAPPQRAAASAPATASTSAVTSCLGEALQRHQLGGHAPARRGQPRPRVPRRPAGRRRPAAAGADRGGAPGTGPGRASRGRSSAGRRGSRRRCARRPPERAGSPRRRGAGSARRSRPARPQALALLRPRAAGSSSAGASTLRQTLEQPAQRLGPRPPGRCLVPVPAGPPGHRSAGPLDLAGEPAQQRGLADARLTRDQDQRRPQPPRHRRSHRQRPGERRPAWPAARIARRTPSPRHCRG